MKPSDQLFRLIKTLTRGERRAFRLFARRYSGKDSNAALELFDLVDRQEAYDEDAVQEALAGTRMGDRLAVHKHRLFELVLASLRSQEASSLLDLQLTEGMEHCMVLHRRGMSKESSRKLEKLIAKAEQFEKYALLVRMLQVDKSVKRRLLSPREFEAYRTGAHTRQLMVMDRLRNQLEYEELVDNFFYLYRSRGEPSTEEIRKAYADFVVHPLLQDPDSALSIKATWNHYFIWSVFHYVHKSFADALICSEAQIDAFRKREGFLEAYLSEYLSVLNNHLSILLELGRYRAFEDRIAELKALGTRKRRSSKLFQRRIFEFASSLELEFYNREGRSEAILGRADEIWERMRSLRDTRGSNDRYIFILLHLALLHFMVGEWSKARLWLRRIEEFDREGIAVNLLAFGRVLELMLLLESGEWELLPYRLEATRRYLRKHELWPKAVQKLLAFIEKATESRNVEAEVWRDLLREMQDAGGNAFATEMIATLHVSAWCRAHLAGTNVQEEVRRLRSDGKSE